MIPSKTMNIQSMQSLQESDSHKWLCCCLLFQVAPAELESLLLKHPAVADAAVVGTPDLEAGQLPTAYIVKRSNIVVTEDELCQFVASQVAPQKKLRGGVKFIEKIPKSAAGKILRRILRDGE